MNQLKMNPEISSRGLSGGQSATVSDLVNYQDGSIVSREIIKKPTGIVTIFAFDEGQGLSEHTAPFDALVQVVEGETEIKIQHSQFKNISVASGQSRWKTSSIGLHHSSGARCLRGFWQGLQQSHHFWVAGSAAIFAMSAAKSSLMYSK